eukprot:TRINITY_DN2940_c0_g1_i2.p1 TRINITY_DN2940_c0_g1~~TRINITY_DN2940_c0_g1_i2.p1  ORF type:complete len:405 (-),score=48.89 TRINITY_DN2940_c0_g1_i2:318-1532(-)
MDFDFVSRFVFPAPPASYDARSYPQELIAVPRSLNPQTCLVEDCVPLMLCRCPGARYLFIFLHSNSEDLGRCRDFCTSLRNGLGVHVLAVEYPGYGICPGSGSHRDARGANECALTALRFAREVLSWPLEYIVLMGRSIGTGPAIALATQMKVGGLVLLSPFLSIKDVARESLGYMANFISERFPNKDLMPKVQCPCIIVHGEEDTMVPCRHSVELHELCGSAKKLLKLVPGLGHSGNYFRSRDIFLEPVCSFFSLPQRCHEDLHVPGWAFDLCAGLLAPSPAAGDDSKSSRCPPARTGCKVSVHSCSCSSTLETREMLVTSCASEAAADVVALKEPHTARPVTPYNDSCGKAQDPSYVEHVLPLERKQPQSDLILSEGRLWNRGDERGRVGGAHSHDIWVSID